ncbi:MAG: type II toxin-antitoxin system VapC family toxin [Firmicutes bacterium]|nr:type II toxin-antitoxin system VapC family toxin [Bacillota bacterium]
MGVKVLLDTHVFLWAVAQPEKLSRESRALLEDDTTTVFVSSATAWEIATKFRLGRFPEAEVLLRDYHGSLRKLLAEELPVLSKHALKAGLLDVAHRDPFDRVLAAQALIEGLPLITKDPVFRDFEVSVIW